MCVRACVRVHDVVMHGEYVCCLYLWLLVDGSFVLCGLVPFLLRVCLVGTNLAWVVLF